MERASNKRVTIFAIVLSLVAVGVLVFGFLLVSSNKVVLLQSISNLYGKITDMSEDELNLLDKLAVSDDVGIKGKFDIKIGKKTYNLSYDYLENKKDSKSNLELVSKNGNKEIFNGNLFLNDKNLYFYLKDITPNYYKVASQYVSIFKSVSGDDYEKIVSLFKDSIDSSIKNDDILKEKTTIKYNGKDKKVNKLTYVIDNKLVGNILTKFVKSVKADKTLFKNVANYLGVSKKELNKILDDGLEMVKSSKNNGTFEYRIYYYGLNKIVQYELYNKEYDMLLKYKVENKEYLDLTVGDTNYLSLEFEKNKKTYTFKGTLLDTYSFTGTLSDNLLELVFKLDKEYKLDVVYSTSSNKENFKSTYQITLSYKKNGEDKKIFIVDADLEYYFGKKIDTNSIDISDATKLDSDSINQLLNTLGISLDDIENMNFIGVSK